MGSMSRYSALEQVKEKYGEEIVSSYKPKLIGKTITQMANFEIDLHLKYDVELDDGSGYNVHDRWATEEEALTNQEVLEDEEDMTVREYFTHRLQNKVIESLKVDFERDDELYLMAFVEGGGCLQIPLGYNPVLGEVSGFLEEFISS